MDAEAEYGISINQYNMWLKTDKYNSPKERERLGELLHDTAELYKYMMEYVYGYGIKPLTPENKRELDGYRHQMENIVRALDGYEWVDVEYKMNKEYPLFFI